MSTGNPAPGSIRCEDRMSIKPHLPACLWFTGLSGSGKSTIARGLEGSLNRAFGAHTYLLDGDLIRTGLNRDLGFSLADRAENIRRLGEVAHLFVDAGLIVLTSFISPLRADRERARAIIEPFHFIEIYVECPLEVCEKRDVKGLYAKARRGEIPDFTGISSPYEPPLHPEIMLHTGTETVEDSTRTVLNYLLSAGILMPDMKVDPV